MEAEIFTEIKSAEKSSEEIINKANQEKNKLIQDAKNKASSMLRQKTEEIDKEQINKIQKFKGNVHVLEDTKVSEGNEDLVKLRKKAQKKQRPFALFNGKL